MPAITNPNTLPEYSQYAPRVNASFLQGSAFPPEYSNSIQNLLTQVRSDIGIFQTSLINNNADSKAHERAAIGSIDSLKEYLDTNRISPEHAQDILGTATKLLGTVESDSIQKSLINLVDMIINKNVQGTINLQFLTSFCDGINHKNQQGQFIQSPDHQLQIINIAQAAFNGIWKANHIETEKPLTDEECIKYSRIIPKMENLLYTINDSHDLQLHAAILKMSLGGFKTTTEHVASPHTEAGQHLKSAINSYINTLGGVMAVHQDKWVDASRSQNKLKSTVAKVLQKTAGASAILQKSLSAICGGVLGSTLGIVGLARLPFGLLAGVGLDLNPLTNPDRGFPNTKGLVGQVLTSPFRHAANGAAGGWDIIDHKNLAYQAYNALYGADENQQRQSAHQIQFIQQQIKDSVLNSQRN